MNRGAVIQQISTEKEHKSGVASFSHDDKLIAVNSSIYDANTSKKINTFMDFGNEETACFHPNNTEYIKGQYVVSSFFLEKVNFYLVKSNLITLRL